MGRLRPVRPQVLVRRLAGRLVPRVRAGGVVSCGYPAIVTWTGRRFDYLAPAEELAKAVCLEDIAHALARICRYGGHVATWWSVADHCLEVSRELEAKATEAGYEDDEVAYLALVGLLHDAAEAYTGDMVAPLKWACEAVVGPGGNGWARIARKVEEAVWLATLGAVPWNRWLRAVADVDLAARRGTADGVAGEERFREGLPPPVAEGAWLTRYHTLRARCPWLEGK